METFVRVLLPFGRPSGHRVTAESSSLAKRLSHRPAVGNLAVAIGYIIALVEECWAGKGAVLERSVA